MQFKKFLIYWVIFVFAIILITVFYPNFFVLLISDTFPTVLTFMLGMIPVYLVFLFLIEKVNPKIKEADNEELEKEDDILLQGVGFSQSVLFILANILLISTNEKLRASILIASTTIPFYVIRAFAKLTNNSKYRYYSMGILGFVLAFSVRTISQILLPQANNFLNNLIDGISIAIAIGFIRLVFDVFSKRYGVKRFPIF